MALIECPNCGQSVSEKASKCPKCDYSFQKNLNSGVQEPEAAHEQWTAAADANCADFPQTAPKKKNRKKTVMILLAAFAAVIAVLAVLFGPKLFVPKLSVKDITISKWRLTDSSKYSDSYEGTVTSEQKEPFVAIVGEYDDKTPKEFVYLGDGKGTIELSVDSDEDPSLTYRPIGYLSGKPVNSSAIDVTYSDDFYHDWSEIETTRCNVLFSIDMNNSKNGLLFFDVNNETNHETEKNLVALVVHGKAEYRYPANLPYKARGIDVTIEPKLFCESKDIKENDYTIEEPFVVEKDVYEGEYYSSNSYSGTIKYSFPDHADGFVLCSKELIDGGNKKNRGVKEQFLRLLEQGKLTLSTYDSVDIDETLVAPTYKFSFYGYITWTLLEKESKK